jgi:hypothetical protein
MKFRSIFLIWAVIGALMPLALGAAWWLGDHISFPGMFALILLVTALNAPALLCGFTFHGASDPDWFIFVSISISAFAYALVGTLICLLIRKFKTLDREVEPFDAR